MTNKMRKISVILFILLVVGLSISKSQPADPPSGPGTNPVVGSGGEDPVDIPIDGGALILLIGGAIYGYRRIKKKKE